MSPAVETKLLAALKKHTPAIVRAALVDDSTKDIGIAKGRVRWAPVVACLRELAWKRVELLDAKERLLATVENEATEMEALAGGSMTPRATEVAQLMGLSLRHTEKMIELHTAALKPTLDALRATVADTTAQAMAWRKEVGREHERVNQLLDRVQRLVAAKEAGDNDGVDAEIGELGELMKYLPLAQMLLGGGLGGGMPPPRKP